MPGLKTNEFPFCPRYADGHEWLARETLARAVDIDKDVASDGWTNWSFLPKVPVKFEPRPFPQPLRPASSGTILLDSPSPPARKKSRVELLEENPGLDVENHKQKLEVEEVKDGRKVEMEDKEQDESKMDAQEEVEDRRKVEIKEQEEEESKMDIEEEEAKVEPADKDHFPRVEEADDF